MRTLVCLLVLLSGALAGPSWQDEMAVRDSLRHLPPNMRFYYLQENHRGGVPGHASEGTVGLRLVGKWGGGPSVKVTGRDSLVYLSRGSEVVVVNFADTANPSILSHIQVNGLVSRSVLVGNRLYVGSTGSDPKYIEVFDVSDPAGPVKLGEVQTMLQDLDVVDTLAYVIARDSFRVFNFADPANPRQVGACRDSGYDVSVCDGYAYVGDRWGLYVLDATDPASPHRVASWGNNVISVKARNTICCVTTGNPNQPGELNFSILDVSVPASPNPVGYLADAGGDEVFLAETLAFLSGYYSGGHGFRIIDISDSTQPTHLGGCLTPGGRWGVWASLSAARGYVADEFAGLTVLRIGNLTSPSVDTNLLKGGVATDVHVEGDLAYVGVGAYGLVVLDISAPDHPVEIGHLDSTRNMVMDAVVARDSFVFAGWQNRPLLRSIDVSEPTNPQMAGGANVTNDPRDMVLRDSFLYIAEDNRFQVVNVARPREPVLVGSCNLPGNSGDLCLQDTLAFVTNAGLFTVNVRNPTAPQVVGSWPGMALGVDVAGVVAYCSGLYFFATLDITNPTSPQRLDSLWLVDVLSDVVVVDSLAFAGGNFMRVFDCSDPRSIEEAGSWVPPDHIERVVYANPYLYLACQDAGVCVLETVMTGVAEPRRAEPPSWGIAATPSVTSTGFSVRITGYSGRPRVCVFNTAGRIVYDHQLPVRHEIAESGWRVELAGLPAGVYHVSVSDGNRRFATKVVKAAGR